MGGVPGIGPMLGSALAGSPLGKMVGAFGGDPAIGMGQAPGGNPFSGMGGGAPQVSASAPPPTGAPGDTSPYVDPRVSAPNSGKPPMVSAPMAAPTVVPTQGGGGNMTNPKESTPATSAPASAGSLAAFRAGIQNNESGGNYQLVGNETNGDRPYGAYGIMGNNVGPWTKAALGRPMGLQEFLASPEAQDKTFDHQFAQYVAKYGAEGAAQAWLGGEGSVGKVDRKDNLGTSVGGYGQKFMNFVNNYDPNAVAGQPSADVMSVKDGMGHSGAVDDHLMQTSLAIMQGKTGAATDPVEPGQPDSPLADTIGRIGNHASQAASAYQGATTGPAQPSLDTGAQDVANASGATMQKRLNGSPNQQQRKQALADRVHNKKVMKA